MKTIERYNDQEIVLISSDDAAKLQNGFSNRYIVQSFSSLILLCLFSIDLARPIGKGVLFVVLAYK